MARVTADTANTLLFAGPEATSRAAAAPNARSPLLRSELAEADQLYATAKTEATAAHFDKAVADMKDAHHFYDQIGKQEQGILDPQVHLVADHSPPPSMPLFAVPTHHARPDSLCGEQP